MDGTAAAATLARPDCHDKMFGVCVLSSSFNRLFVGHLNRSTGQKLGGQPLRRWRLRDLERSNIILIAMLTGLALLAYIYAIDMQ